MPIPVIDLRQQLQNSLRGRVCLMGIGNPEYGDDAFGVRLAERLVKAGVPDVIIAGTSPDRWISKLTHPGFGTVLFLDAVDFGGEPASVVLLDIAEISARFPQISTHKISLGVLARWAEANGTTKALLMGVQPESLKQGQALSPKLETTFELLTDILADVKARADADDHDEVRTVPAHEKEEQFL